MRLYGKKALVTGASSGIGHAVAVRLAQDGSDVCINYVHGAAGAEATAEAVRSAGRQGLVVQADMAQVDAAAILVQSCVDALGGLDIMVNNAGFARRAPILEATQADWDTVVDVTLRGVFFGIQAAARHMVQQGGGRIINVSSIHEDAAMPGFSSYCAAKGGVRMLMRTAAVELARYGITVNNVAPGAIATRATAPVLGDPAALAELHAAIPMGRVGTPEDVAGVVAFLASDDAAYITGSTYVVDGGMLRHFTDK